MLKDIIERRQQRPIQLEVQTLMHAEERLLGAVVNHAEHHWSFIGCMNRNCIRSHDFSQRLRFNKFFRPQRMQGLQQLLHRMIVRRFLRS